MSKDKFYAAGHTLPKCLNKGCDNDVCVRDWKNWSLKPECSSCIAARKKGIDIPGVTKHKKDHCENANGFLGFDCPVPDKNSWTMFQNGLDLDHVDGDKYNNIPENVKTLCKLCHGKKSIDNGDCDSNKESAKKLTDES